MKQYLLSARKRNVKGGKEDEYGIRHYLRIIFILPVAQSVLFWQYLYYKKAKYLKRKRETGRDKYDNSNCYIRSNI